MKFKKGEPAEPEAVADLDVVVAANRCPFCRDDVAATESVACVTCLTRHHRECWDEAGVCSSCGGGERLEPRSAPAAEETLASFSQVSSEQVFQGRALLGSITTWGAAFLAATPLVRFLPRQVLPSLSYGDTLYYELVVFLPLIVAGVVALASLRQLVWGDRKGALVGGGLSLLQVLTSGSLLALGYVGIDKFPQWFWLIVLPVAAALALCGRLAKRQAHPET